MTCPSSWETASPKWACAGVTLKQRERDWLAKYPCPPQASRHSWMPLWAVHDPSGLLEQPIAWISLPIPAWETQIYSTLLHKNRALQIHTCCMLTHCVTVVFQHLSNLKLNKVHQDGFGEVFKSIGCRQVRNQTPLLGKHTISRWNIITAATLTHLLTVAVQY